MPRGSGDIKSEMRDGVILDPERRGVEPRAGALGYCRAFADPGSVDEANRRIRFRCSTKNLDRYGEIVEPEAFRASLASFLANPVFMAGHVYIGTSGEPTTIGRWVELKITADGLEGVAEFMAGDELAERYWARYAGGYQKAVSVGFIVRGWEMREQEIDGRKQRVRVFTEVELIEVSAVAIPANRESLIRAAGLLAPAPAPGRAAGGPGTDAPAAGDETGIEALSKALQPAIERAIDRRLDASPGGSVGVLIQDTVEATLAAVGYSVELEKYHGVPHEGAADDPGSDDPGAAGGEDDDELKHMLRGMLGQPEKPGDEGTDP